jgi:hypothetical protein
MLEQSILNDTGREMAPLLPGVHRKELNLLAAHFIAFFLIPYLPRSVLILTDNIFVRLILLVSLISAAYVSPIVAVATFVLIALLFVERNKAKMTHLKSAMEQSTPESEAIADIVTPETAPAQPEFDTPTVRSHAYMPQNDSGDNSFAPVAESMNQKQPLPTECSNDGVNKAISQLFWWVNPAPAQAP